MLKVRLTTSFTFSVMANFPQPTSELFDLCIIIGDPTRLAALMHLYQEYISEEWYEPWESYIWVAGDL